MWDLIVSVPDHCLSFYSKWLYHLYCVFSNDVTDVKCHKRLWNYAVRDCFWVIIH